MGGEVNHVTGNVTRAWRFRARAFTIYSAAGAIFFGTFAMATLVMFVSSTDVRANIPMPRQLQIAIMLVMAAMFVIAFILARLFIRYRRVSLLVEKHDGAVCPSCIRPLEPPDNGRGNDDHPSHREAMGSCTRCEARFEINTLRWHWGNRPNPAWVLSKWQLHRARPRSPLGAARVRFGKWLYRDGLRLPLFVSAANATWICSCAYLVSSPIHMAPAYLTFRALPLVLLTVGFAMLCLSFRMIEHLELRCRSCRYQMQADAEPPPRCPECGSWWNLIGGLVVTSYRLRPLLLTASSLMACIGLIMLIGGMTHDLPQRYATTDTLINVVLREHDSPYRTVPEWRELRGSRDLTEKQRHFLFDGLMRMRDAGNLPIGFAHLWISDQLSDGRLTDAQRDRFLDGMAMFSIDGPHRLHRDEPAILTIAVDYRHSAGRFGAEHIYFGGFRLDADSTPAERAESSVRLEQFGQRTRPSLPGLSTPEPYVPQLPLDVDTPGEYTLTADLWIVIHPPRYGSQTIHWSDDHAPILDEETVLWKQHIPLTHTFTVPPE